MVTPYYFGFRFGTLMRRQFARDVIAWLSISSVRSTGENEAFAYKMRAREECHVQNGRRYVRITIPDRASALSVSADMNARMRGEQ